MTHSQPNQNAIHQSLIPMLCVWIRSIGWTIVLSAGLAVLFALLCDGCSGIH